MVRRATRADVGSIGAIYREHRPQAQVWILHLRQAAQSCQGDGEDVVHIYLFCCLNVRSLRARDAMDREVD
jgi:hypothetical protein